MASKIYILIKDSVDLGHAMVAAAHAPLVYSKHIEETATRDKPHHDCLKKEWNEWSTNSFRKVVCKVTEEEFKEAKTIELPHVVLTESGLDNQEVALVFGPQEEWPKFFKYLKLYK